MTVQSTVNKITHLVSDIGQTEYIYDFRVDESDQMIVFLNDIQQSAGDYTVNDLGSLTGGTITISFTTALNDQLLILREMPLTQLLDYITYGKFPSATHEKGLDYGVMIDQQLEEQYSRVMRFPVYEDVDPILPSPEDDYALVWENDALVNKLYANSGGEVLIHNDHDLNGRHLVFESVADLAANPFTPFENQKVSLLGYTEPGDGADGDFVWYSSDLSTEVALDTRSGIYVAQTNISASGSSGAWVRADIAVLNVKWFMGKPDGTTNNVNAFDAVESMRSLFPLKIYVPGDENEYVISNIAIIDNFYIYGDGVENTTIKFYQDGVTVRQMFKSLSTNVSTDVADNNKNFTFRDITFRGTCDIDGFSEFRHIALFKGVSDVLFNDCDFVGFQGDAIGLQSVDEYNNEHISVVHCTFDGINQANRNAISVQSANQMLINNCTFKNCTEPTMPGAIDFEPNPGYTWAVLKDIKITNNNFNNIGGNIGAIAWFNQVTVSTMVTPPSDITIEDNHLDGVFRGIYINQFQSAQPDETTENFNLKILNNTVMNATDKSYWLLGIKKIDMVGNLFDGSPDASRIGWTDIEKACYDVTCLRNTYKNCGDLSTVVNVVNVYNSNRVSFIKETFDTCGVGTSISYCIYIADGICSYIDMIRCASVNSTFSSMISRNNATTTVDALTNTLIGNKPGSGTGGINSNFPANYQIDDKMVIKSGLGVGNSVAATTPGTVTDKMEVFDAAGDSIGFVPIYDAIT